MDAKEEEKKAPTPKYVFNTNGAPVYMGNVTNNKDCNNNNSKDCNNNNNNKDCNHNNTNNNDNSTKNTTHNGPVVTSAAAGAQVANDIINIDTSTSNKPAASIESKIGTVVKNGISKIGSYLMNKVAGNGAAGAVVSMVTSVGTFERILNKFVSTGKHSEPLLKVLFDLTGELALPRTRANYKFLGLCRLYELQLEWVDVFIEFAENLGYEGIEDSKGNIVALKLSMWGEKTNTNAVAAIVKVWTAPEASEKEDSDVKNLQVPNMFESAPKLKQDDEKCDEAEGLPPLMAAGPSSPGVFPDLRSHLTPPAGARHRTHLRQDSDELQQQQQKSQLDPEAKQKPLHVDLNLSSLFATAGRENSASRRLKHFGFVLGQKVSDAAVQVWLKSKNGSNKNSSSSSSSSITASKSVSKPVTGTFFKYGSRGPAKLRDMPSIGNAGNGKEAGATRGTQGTQGTQGKGQKIGQIGQIGQNGRRKRKTQEAGIEGSRSAYLEESGNLDDSEISMHSQRHLPQVPVGSGWKGKTSGNGGNGGKRGNGGNGVGSVDAVDAMYGISGMDGIGGAMGTSQGPSARDDARSGRLRRYNVNKTGSGRETTTPKTTKKRMRV